MRIHNVYKQVRILSILLAVLLLFPCAYAQDEAAYGDDCLECQSAERFENAGIHYPLSDLYNMNDFRQIADSAQKVLSIFPDDIFATEVLSTALFNLKEDRKAVDLALIALDSDKSEQAFNLLDYAAKWTDPDYVIEQLAPRIRNTVANQEVNTRLYRYLFIAATALETKGDLVNAFDLLKSCRQIDDTLDVLITMSTMQIRTGNSKHAVELLEPYKTEYYDNWTFINNYTLALRDSGNGDKAIKLYEQIYSDLQPDEIHDINYAVLLAALGKTDKAMQIFDNIIRIHLEEAAIDGDYCDRNYTEALIRQATMLKKGSNDSRRLLNLAKESTTLCDDSIGLEATIMAWLGDKKGLENILETDNAYNARYKSSLYYVVGDMDNAFRYLGEAFDKHLTCPDQIKYDPNYSGITNMKQYKKLVKNYIHLELK